MNESPIALAPTEREPYERPLVIEDLPLESKSLACNSKADLSCDDGGLGNPS